jgi:hypothetical protein
MFRAVISNRPWSTARPGIVVARRSSVPHACALQKPLMPSCRPPLTRRQSAPRYRSCGACRATKGLPMKLSFAGLRAGIPARIRAHSKHLSLCLALLLAYALWALVAGPFLFPDPDPESLIRGRAMDVYWTIFTQPTRKSRIAPGSAQADAVIALLKSHKGQWMRRFLPVWSNLDIVGDDFGISVCLDEEVLVWYYNGHFEVVCPMSRGEFRRFSEALMVGSTPYHD